MSIQGSLRAPRAPIPRRGRKRPGHPAPRPFPSPARRAPLLDEAHLGIDHFPTTRVILGRPVIKGQPETRHTRPDTVRRIRNRQNISVDRIARAIRYVAVAVPLIVVRGLPGTNSAEGIGIRV